MGVETIFALSLYPPQAMDGLVCSHQASLLELTHCTCLVLARGCQITSTQLILLVFQNPT